jgi:hypothetical protein
LAKRRHDFKRQSRRAASKSSPIVVGIATNANTLAPPYSAGHHHEPRISRGGHGELREHVGGDTCRPRSACCLRQRIQHSKHEFESAAGRRADADVGTTTSDENGRFHTDPVQALRFGSDQELRDIHENESDGATVVSNGAIGTVPTTWTMAQTGDFNGDRKSDLLWRDTAGDTSIWFMNGVSVASTGNVGIIPTIWTLQTANSD